MPDAAGVRPVTSHTSAGEEWGDWLVEEEMIGDELLLGGVGHLVQGVVLT